MSRPKGGRSVQLRITAIVTLSLYGPQLKRSRSVVFITNASPLVMKTTLLDHLSLGAYKVKRS